ncbi:hypothetical protein BFW01_g5332 [Lasiodiplodia theobromae]|uniref:F-box domain-containing protein n=1 Tax=Lasiodiplodia theobromae TaxID=45133 RepID=A0A5N5CWW8_9PEZI|nr:uncharacterized protein LTHEOB_12070 [Lasiodiplodia theobromae]KAB2569858.1 hypothetical protein DBV05_g11483 [Lasiodiplodia theobromae]KAF4536630.1 hypothetical protein LTHEOB_12070 [Lasiodiplodia theobromae]KAF9634437.1 hypothetical protein BFW01_g5332 [Lasiodiplodia theobromae]
MSSKPNLTLANVLAMPVAQAEREQEKPATVLAKNRCSMLFTTTDPAVGSSSGQHEPSTKLPMCIGDVIRSNLDVEDLLNVRLVNKDMKAWIEGDDFEFTAKAFNTLHMNRRLWNSVEEQLAISALQNVACFCNHFYIHLDNMLDPMLPMVHEGVSVFDPKKKSIWMQVFAALGSILTLSISAPGQPDWHKFGSGESILESIRVALENNLPAGLHDVTLSPINATGLLHFRWRGAAFKETTWLAEAFWRSLTTLTLDLYNPLPDYNRCNQKDFIKTLHDYLDSFSRSLKVIRFSWIGPAGPNPLLLDIRYGGHNFSSPAIVWTALVEAHLKNVFAHDGDLVALRKDRCPRLENFKLTDEETVNNHETVVWEEDKESDGGLEHVNSNEISPLPFPFSLK